MKRIILIIALLLPLALNAQVNLPDSTLYESVDTLLYGKDIMSLLGKNVSVEQTSAVRTALIEYTRENGGKPIQGYRVRVFYDNSPQARDKSGEVEALLKAKYPQEGVYRSFENPNYKVTLGDFRTREEALKLFMELRRAYPTAYIIKEEINYPQ